MVLFGRFSGPLLPQPLSNEIAKMSATIVEYLFNEYADILIL